jgi:hypothetical protein
MSAIPWQNSELILTNKVARRRDIILQRHTFKLSRLFELKNKNQPNQLQNTNNLNPWVINLTNEPMSNEIEAVLNLGPKFVPTPKPHFAIPKLIAAIESEICNLENAEEIRDEIRPVLRNCMKNPPKPNLTQTEHKGIQQLLKKADTWATVEGDKTNATAVVNRENLKKEVHLQFDNSENFEKINYNPLKFVTAQVIELVDNLKTEGKISPKLSQQLKQRNPKLAQPLPQIKLHKQDTPFRIIASNVDTPIQPLEQFLAKNCRSLVHNRHTVSNSQEFIQKIQEVKIEADSRCTSFDVKNMYPTLPQKLVYEAIKKHGPTLEKALPGHKLTSQDFLNITKLIFITTYIEHEGNFYMQKKGAPIGYTVSGEMAEIVFQELDEEVHKLFPNLKLWTRYRDDIFVIGDQQIIAEVLDHINSWHKDIVFTQEPEKENHTIPFLDVLVTRQLDQLTTSHFQKPQQTDRTLNFRSFHSFATKKNITQQEAERIKTAGQQEALTKPQQQQIFQKFTKNGYPTQVAKHQNNTKKANQEFDRTVIIPFYGNTTAQIKRILARHNIQTHFRSWPNIRSKTRPKKSKQVPTDVVYKIPCQSCDDFYIGQTGTTIDKRIQQHKYAVKNFDQNNGPAVHKINTGHQMDWQKTTIIFNEKHAKTRLALESATINQHRSNTINLNGGFHQQIATLIPKNFRWPGGATTANTNPGEQTKPNRHDTTPNDVNMACRSVPK